MTIFKSYVSHYQRVVHTRCVLREAIEPWCLNAAVLCCNEGNSTVRSWAHAESSHPTKNTTNSQGWELLRAAETHPASGGHGFLSLCITFSTSSELKAAY